MRCPLHVGSRWATALGIIFMDIANAEMRLLVGSVSVLVSQCCSVRVLVAVQHPKELAKSSAKTLGSNRPRRLFFYCQDLPLRGGWGSGGASGFLGAPLP